MLETVGVAVDDALLADWEARVRRVRAALGWPDGALVARAHRSGASLALAAPLDQLLTATEVDEWALSSALVARGGADAFGVLHAPGHAAAWDEDSALHTLRAFAAAERNPDLIDFVLAAEAHGLTVLIDEEVVSLGVGAGSRRWPLAQLPKPAGIDWSVLHDAPIALVTGSNGKTTTTRLIAAALRAHGRSVAYTCTDGVFVGAAALAAGDYSGPAGARTALRAEGVDAAVLETARGGLLRRGLAVRHADVAVVTNVSDDHFGEYGVHDLDDLAAVKLSVARALDEDGVLVLNAGDAQLVRTAARASGRLAWFALDLDRALAQARAGEPSCGARDGRLILRVDEAEHDLGAIAAMPLSFGGVARYNVANLAAAALAAHALGVAPRTLRELFARFGAAREDNPGRLQHWSVGGIEVFVDYAHNPDGLRGLLELATHGRRGRLGLLLGQAGNREDAEIRELAAVAAAFAPEQVVLKDIPGFLRGRADGEVPAILRRELVERGVAAERIVLELDEFEAVRRAFGWARAGDLLVLPVHGNAIKPRVAALLDTLQAGGWQAGEPLPIAEATAPAG
ncbi:Mur ligase family protein [Dokdonella sp.]|uniref:Mur ligase family protein n=1 Tax=Dokdonella sp. TaxID=2291710 RepID=UPI0025C3FA43|nr:Mur ligase family protein [Dokdonella sp.]